MKKQQVFYIHGGEAYSKYEGYLNFLRTAPVSLPGDDVSTKRWTKTLTEDLGEDFEVFTPTMPNKHCAKYQEWKIWFERYFEYLHDGVILLGWSQGGMFLVKYLIENELPFVPRALILVAAPFEAAVVVDDAEDGGDFLFASDRVGELQKKAKNIVIMHSEDDFVVPFAHAEKYHLALPVAELMSFTDKNHFLIEKFPELLEKIRSLR